MAQLIMNWINEEVCLSRRITSLEEDFKDGYLLGELLAFFNQQDDFDKFLSKGNPDAMINNFCLLEISFKRLGIAFNSKIAFDVMNGNAGVIRTLLYEIKTGIDRIVKTSQPIVVKSEGGERGEKLVRVVPTTKPMYDKTMSQTFENCVRAGIENPSNVLINKATSRFMEKEREFYRTVEKLEKASENNYQEEFQRKKQMERQRKRQGKEFMETWEKMNVEQWKTNQLAARERKLLKQKVEQFANSKKETAYYNMRVDARDQMMKGIDEFEDKLRNVVFPPDPDLHNTVGKAFTSYGGGDESDIPTLTAMKKEYLDAGLAHSRQKLKEHHEELMQTQKVHNRRRLKFFSNSESSHIQSLRSKSESEIVQQLLVPSFTELNAENSRQEILLTVPMAKENAENRDVLVSEMDKIADERALGVATEKASREFNWIVKPRISAQIDLLETCKSAEISARLKETIETAECTLSKILDLVDFVSWTRDFANYKGKTFGTEENEILLPSHLWKDAVRIFTSDLPMPPPIPYTEIINDTKELPFRLNYKPKFADAKWLFKGIFAADDILSYNSTDTSSSSMLATSDKDDFVCSLVQCVSEEAELKSGPGIEFDPNDTDTALPPDWVVACPPDYFLGEAIVAIKCAVDPIPSDPVPPIVFPPDVLRLCVCGNSATAREAVSTQLKADYGVEILVVENLLTEACKAGKDFCADGENNTYDELCSKVYNSVVRGDNITDQTYVDVIFAKLQELVASEDFKGFVLEDFPRTLNQSRLLLLALSGIDYTLDKPHSTDRASVLAPTTPTERPYYDIGKCGLDGVIGLDTDVQRVITERISARKELKTGNIVYVDESCTDVSTMAEPYEPLNQPMTAAADLKMGNDLLQELKEFVSGLGLWKTFSTAEDGDDRLLATKVSREILTLFPHKSKNYPEQQIQEEKVIEGEVAAENETIDNAALDPHAEPEVSQETQVKSAAEFSESTDLENASDEPAIVKPPQRRLTVPFQISKVLNGLWSVAEENFVLVTEETFRELRNIRYQMLQRIRGSCNVINEMIIRRDTKQKLFEEFRDNEFNNEDNDFRFDTDMMYEFYMRVLEFDQRMQEVTNTRRTEINEEIAVTKKDGAILALIHRSKCEAAGLIQAELDRFNTACHVIFDTSKVLCKFNHRVQIYNTLEETLPEPDDESGTAPDIGNKDKGKDKGKGKGDGPPVPYRPVFAPNILDAELMAAVPTYEEPVEEDPKAKGKDKGKGEPAAPKDPFTDAEAKALEFLSVWSKDHFTVNRSLYAYDDGAPVDPKAKGKGNAPADPVVESVCTSVEKAIWCEADRCKRSIEYIKGVLSEHIAWLESMETFLMEHLAKLVHEQWERESRANNRLIWMIIEKIELCEQIRETWLISADSIAVLTSNLIIPDPPPRPEPVIKEFYDYKLNDEQMEVLTEMIHEIKVGEYVIHEDLVQLSDHICNAPMDGCCRVEHAGQEETRIRCLKLPEKLAEITEDDDYQANEFLRRLIFRDQDYMDGFYKEHYGMIHVDLLLDRVRNNLDLSKPSCKKVINV